MTDKKTKKSKRKAPRVSVKSLKEKNIVLENDLIIKSEETQRIKDKNIRLLAEFDNYKRRTQEESDLIKQETEGRRAITSG